MRRTERPLTTAEYAHLATALAKHRQTADWLDSVLRRQYSPAEATSYRLYRRPATRQERRCVRDDRRPGILVGSINYHPQRAPGPDGGRWMAQCNVAHAAADGECLPATRCWARKRWSDAVAILIWHAASYGDQPVGNARNAQQAPTRRKPCPNPTPPPRRGSTSIPTPTDPSGCT